MIEQMTKLTREYLWVKFDEREGGLFHRPFIYDDTMILLKSEKGEIKGNENGWTDSFPAFLEVLFDNDRQSNLLPGLKLNMYIVYNVDSPSVIFQSQHFSNDSIAVLDFFYMRKLSRTASQAFITYSIDFWISSPLLSMLPRNGGIVTKFLSCVVLTFIEW